MKKITLFSISATLCLSSFSNAATEVARVNDKVITSDQLNAAVIEQSQSGGAALSRKAVLDELIRREVAIQEAKREKVDQDPMVLERLNNALYYAFVEKRLGNEIQKMRVSDGEARSWYGKNPEIRTSHIFIALSPSASTEDEKAASNRLTQIMSEIKSGKISFAEAAQKYSEDPSSTLGGDLDYRTKDKLDPAYFRAAIRLGKTGDMTGPVRSAFGLHLVRLTGKHAFNEVDRNAIKRVILDEKRKDVVSQYLNGLRQKAKVSINDKAI